MRGTVKNWNAGRGYGFIMPDEGGDDIFVHIRNSLQGELVPGEVVEYQSKIGINGKWEATEVRVVEKRSGPDARTLHRVDPAPAAPDAPAGRRSIFDPEDRARLGKDATDALMRILGGGADQDAALLEQRVAAGRLVLEAISEDAREAE